MEDGTGNGVALNVGEALLVRMLGARVQPGEAFDVLEERMHGNREHVNLLRGMSEDGMISIMEGMAEKGLVRSEGARGWYSLTEFGKACWQAIADTFAPTARGYNGAYRGARGVPTGRGSE